MTEVAYYIGWLVGAGMIAIPAALVALALPYLIWRWFWGNGRIGRW